MNTIKTLKYFSLLGLILVLLILGGFFYSTAQADNFNYTFFNHTADTAWTIFDNGEVGQGWFSVIIYGSREFSSSRSTIYFYAQSDNGHAGGDTRRLIHPNKKYKIIYSGQGWCKGYVGDTNFDADCSRLADRYGFKKYGFWKVNISEPQEIHYYGNYVMRVDDSSRIYAYTNDYDKVSGCLRSSQDKVVFHQKCNFTDENKFGFYFYRDNKFQLRSIRYPRSCAGINPDSNFTQVRALYLASCDNYDLTLFQLKPKRAAGIHQPPRIVHQKSGNCLQIIDNGDYSPIVSASCSWKNNSKQGFEFPDFNMWEKGFR